MASSKKNEEAIVKEAPAGALTESDYDYGDDAGSGFENIGKADLRTPFIKQLQGLSPEVAESLVEGAKPGMFFNTATSDLYPAEPGLIVVPIAKTLHFVEWKQRAHGGGFVAAHAASSEQVAKVVAANGKKFGKLLTNPKDPNSTELIETHDMLVALLDPTGRIPTGDMAIFSFTSSKIKACRDWVTKMWSVKPEPGKKRFPFWAFRSRISGFKDPNQSKGVFFNTKVSPFMPDPTLAAKLGSEWKATLIQRQSEAKLFDTCKAFYEMWSTGEVKPDYESQKNTSGEAVGEDAVPF